MRQRARTPTARRCTRREIGPMDVEDEASRCAMEAADEIKEGGTEMEQSPSDPLSLDHSLLPSSFASYVPVAEPQLA